MKTKAMISELIEQYKYAGDAEVELCFAKAGQKPQFYTITYSTEGGVFMLKEANNES